VSNSENSRISLAEIVEALAAKDVNRLKVMAEACLRRESEQIDTAAAWLDGFQRMTCVCSTQDMMPFVPSSGILGPFENGSVLAAGWNTSRNEVHVWYGRDLVKSTRCLSANSKAIDNIALMPDHTLRLVFKDGSIDYIDVSSLDYLRNIVSSQMDSHPKSHCIKIFCENTGHVVVL
jgi:hypothetical protein